MILTCAILAGCVLDLVFADPPRIPHPVVLMGTCISKMEAFLRSVLSRDTSAEQRNAQNPGRERISGMILAVSLPIVVFFLTFGVCRLCLWIHPALYFAIEAFWCFQALAAKGLAQEAEAVGIILERYDQDPGRIATDSAGKALKDEHGGYSCDEAGIIAARKQLSRIVGRDTEQLDEAGITRACVETVAENSSDGVSAPLFYMLIGGAPLALTYKAINTMDSMIGYRNERYRFFGWAAAKLDDAANFLPSRITALFWIAAAYLDPEADGAQAWKIFLRDRNKHASPNSAQTESACAGALHVRLAGPASYFGKKVEKPWIGDDDRPIKTQDIRRSVRLMWISCAMALVVGASIRCLVLLSFG